MHVPNPQWQLTGSLENDCPFSAPIPRLGRRTRSHWCCGGPFKAALCRTGWEIGGSHKAESYMLSTRSAGMVGAIANRGHVGTEI